MKLSSDKLWLLNTLIHYSLWFSSYCVLRTAFNGFLLRVIYGSLRLWCYDSLSFFCCEFRLLVFIFTVFHLFHISFSIIISQISFVHTFGDHNRSHNSIQTIWTLNWNRRKYSIPIINNQQHPSCNFERFFEIDNCYELWYRPSYLMNVSIMCRWEFVNPQNIQQSYFEFKFQRSHFEFKLYNQNV